MAYNRTFWADGSTYGADAFNNIEEGILGLESAINNGSGGYKNKQTKNLANALKKLRTNQQTEFCFMGDSVFFGFDMMNEDGDAFAETCVTDKGVPLEGYKRSPVTIYDTFIEVMNKVYENNIKLKKKIYTGDTIWTAFYRWNPSKSDFTIMNYGINDAVGSHITDSYHPEIPSGYRGNIELFIQGYRRMIEQELDGGSAVVLLTPTKQTLLLEGTDTDGRTLIDVYEQAVKNLGIEYGCPVIDGNEITKNFGNDLSIDFCHFTKEGFRAIGYRLASVFIGQSPLFPLLVTNGTYLGVNPHLDNANISLPSVLSNTELSPNIPIMLNSADLGENINRVTGGLQANVTGSGSIVWSFYCEADGMVVVPCFYTKDAMDVNVKLDFGANQGKWSNYWNCVSSTSEIDRNYIEPSVVTIENATMVTKGEGKVYGLHVLDNPTQPVIKITTKGWHTIEITPKPKDRPVLISDIPEDFGNGVIEVFGLNFLSLDEYKKKVNK